MSGGDLFAAAEAILAVAAERHAWLADLDLVGIGWATVELDRAAREAEEGLPGAWVAGQPDRLLGASTRLRPTGRDGVTLILLEPDTEGRLAASLARFGEGVAAVYLAGDRGGDARNDVGSAYLGRPEPGPLGPGRLVSGAPAWGPHLIVLDPMVGSSPGSPALAVDDLVE
jgi:hypothetical protein